MAAIGRPRRNGMDLAPDVPIVRRIAEAFSSPQVDPLFRRRLRSDVVNRYVAVREGHLAGRAASRPLVHGGVMGRLGRACLYASVALAGSAAGMLAASQTALPGDALYDVKLRIDAVRLEAAPADLRAAVAEYIVGERLDELTVLAADGEWARATEAAEAAGAQAESLAALLPADPAVEARIQRHLDVLASLLTTAPPEARDALTHAMAISDNAIGPAPGHAPNANGGGGNEAANGNGSGNANSNAAGAEHGTGGSGGSVGGNANGTGDGAGDGGAGAEDVPDAVTPTTTPAPSASAEEEAENEEAQGGAGDAEGANDHPAPPEPPSPTPRASIPPRANQGSE